MVENGHSLSSSSYTAPHHLVKSIFCLRLRGFCSYHHLDRQVSSAGEAMEHGLSGTLQSRAMRRKGVTTHTNRKHCLYPYAAQKPLIVAHRTITYSITDLHSNLQYRKDWGKKNCPAASWLTTHFFFHGFLVQPATWHICALWCHVSLFREGDTKCLAAPAPITWPASWPPHLCILFALGACTRAHTNTQQLPEVLKSYRFFTQCWIMYSELKKNYIHYDRISEHGVGGWTPAKHRKQFRYK